MVIWLIERGDFLFRYTVPLLRARILSALQGKLYLMSYQALLNDLLSRPHMHMHILLYGAHSKLIMYKYVSPINSYSYCRRL